MVEKTMDSLINKVELWAEERGLHLADSKAQTLKVVEEFTETLIAFDDGDINAVIDGIGDTYVTLIILSNQISLDFRAFYDVVKNQEILKGSELDVHLGGRSKKVQPKSRDIHVDINNLVSGVAKNKYNLTKIGMYGIVLTLIQIENIYEVSDTDCLLAAYNEIKNREGKMVNGVFMKIEDWKEFFANEHLGEWVE